MTLITTDMAIGHLRYTPEDLFDLERKMASASALVMTYLKRPELLTDSPAWTVQTDPSTDAEFAIVQAAILEVLANMYQHRGDGDTHVDGPLTQRVKNALSMLRDPALA